MTEQSARADTYKCQFLQKGLPVLKKYNIQGVYLFGSVATGRCRRRSDIDLYVYPLEAKQYWSFRHELEEAMQLPIDLYTDSDDPVFVQKIVKRGVKIYGL